MSILTDNSFRINTIRNYTIDPAAYNQHLHKDLLKLRNQLLKDREYKQLKTHIAEVGFSTPCDSASTEVEPGLIAGSVLRLRVETSGVLAAVRVTPGAARGSDLGRGGTIWRGGAGPSPLSDPGNPVLNIEVSWGLSRDASPVSCRSAPKF